jgi:coatomer protein complex subunit gamma
MNFLSNILREEGGFEYKKAIVDSIVILIRDIPDAKESGLLHLCEFIEDCEITSLSTQVALYSIIICCTISSNFHFFNN